MDSDDVDCLDIDDDDDTALAPGAHLGGAFHAFSNISNTQMPPQSGRVAAHSHTLPPMPSASRDVPSSHAPQQQQLQQPLGSVMHPDRPARRRIPGPIGKLQDMRERQLDWAAQDDRPTAVLRFGQAAGQDVDSDFQAASWQAALQSLDIDEFTGTAPPAHPHATHVPFMLKVSGSINPHGTVGRVSAA
jgi:hypothetical protein